MGFKQNNDQHHKNFLKSSREILLETGIPLRTWESDAWAYLLEHGNCCYTGWTIDNLSRQQLMKLLSLVDDYGGNYSDVLKRNIKNAVAAAYNNAYKSCWQSLIINY
jgi:hypothetical protein